MKLPPRAFWTILLAFFATVASSRAQSSTDPWGNTSTGSSTGGAVLIVGDTGGTFDGVTTVTGGTLQISSYNPIQGNGGTITATTGGTLTLDGGTSTVSGGGVLLQSYNPIYTGGGTLTLNPIGGTIFAGSGGLTLTGTTTFTGGTIIGTSPILGGDSGATLTLGAGTLSGIITNGAGTITTGTGIITAGTGIIKTGTGTLTLGPGIGNTLNLNSTETTEAANSVVPALVPEPSAVALLACGLALGFRRSRKR